MSTPEAPLPGPQPGQPAADTTPGFDEIRVYSHSPLFYWWPVWLFGFIFSLITLMDGDRLVIVPGNSLLVKEKVGQETRYTVYAPPAAERMDQLVDPATPEAKQELKRVSPNLPDAEEAYKIKPRVSPRSWMGPSFLFILILVIVITNVPLRGLWSLVVLIG